MALRYKILLTFCISVILLIIQSNITSYYTYKLQAATNDLTSSVKTTRAILNAQLYQQKLDLSLKNISALVEPTQIIDAVKTLGIDMIKLDNYITTINQELAVLNKFHNYTSTLIIKTEELKQTIRWLVQKRSTLLDIKEINALLKSIETSFATIAATFTQLNSDLETEIKLALIAEKNLHNLPTIASSIVTIIATFLMFMAGFILSRHIALDIDKLNSYLYAIANENFGTAKPDLNRNDEIANLSNSIVAMAKKLAKTQMRLKGVISAMPSVLIGIAKNYSITDWNLEAEKLTGKDFKTVQQQSIWDAYPLLLQFKLEIDSALNYNTFVKKDKLDNIFVAANVDKQNIVDVYHEMTIYPIVNDYYHGVVIRIDDITEKIRINNIIYEKEKMLYVTSLFSGVAYELDVPLTTIKQNVQNILRRIDENLDTNVEVSQSLNLDLKILHKYLDARKIPAFLEAMEKSSEQAANIARNLLSFNKKKRAIKVAANVSQMINNAIESTKLDALVRKIIDFTTIKITKNFADNLPDVACYQVEIEQALINIIKNAVYAMAKTKDKEHELTFTTYQDHKNDNVVLEIKDNGMGISKENMNKMFEPFFTTNAPGEGTGLGLPVAKGIIVENHGGYIDVNSTIDIGTTVKISLPINSTD